MKIHTQQNRLFHVIAALAVVLVLAGVLGARLMARWEPATAGAAVEPAPATVPAPMTCTLADLDVPCWSCPEARDWPVRFRTDLDLLAPLGTGEMNAAEWFFPFWKPDGPRFEEFQAALERREEYPGLGKVLPADDPLLAEAEPWCDQARMWYYPDYFEMEGYATRIPNLVISLTLANSWVARGRECADAESALEDFRRAIRLGRLLRQDNTTIIADLVGLVCIQRGAAGIYDMARFRGDAELALTASVVLGEVAPQRLITSQRVTTVGFSDHAARDDAGSLVLRVPGERLTEIIEIATGDPDRRFRIEALLKLNLVWFHGADNQREQVRTVLDSVSRSEDPILAEVARWSRDTKPSDEYLAEFLTE